MDLVEVNDTEMDNELPYDADQWSPFNKNGKKVYSLEFLMALRRAPKSNELPKNIPEAILTINTNKEIPCKKKKKKNKNTDELLCQFIANNNCDAIHGDLSTIPEALSSDNEIDLISFTVDEYLVEKQNMLPGNTAKQEILVSKQENMVFHKANAAIVQPKTIEISLDYLPDQPKVAEIVYKVLEDNLNNRCSVQQCMIQIQTSISVSEISQLVSFGTRSVLNQSKISRLRTGFLFSELIKMKILSISNYCVGLEVIFKQADQLLIDVPKLWSCVAEVISPALCDDAIMLNDLLNILKLLGSTKNYVPELLHCLFKLIIQDRSIQFLQKNWKNSNFQFSDFMDECEVEDYIKRNSFEFLLKSDTATLPLRSFTPHITSRFHPMIVKPLGSIKMYGSCSRSSNIKTQLPLTDTANMYAALENIGTGSYKRPALGLRMNNNDPYNLKDSILERTHRQLLKDGSETPFGLQHRSHNSSTSSQCNTTPTPVPSVAKPQSPRVSAPVELTPVQLKHQLTNIFEEYHNYYCDIEQTDKNIKTFISPSALPQLVSEGYIKVLERSKTARLRTGYLFAYLIKVGTLTLQDYCAGLETVLEEANELIIDIPLVWNYVAELISPVLCESSVTLKDLHKSFEPLLRKNHASKLLVCLFKLIIQEKGLNFLQSCWNSSGFTFADYMAESQVDSYIKENSFEFLLEAGDTSPVNQSHSPLSYEEMHEKLISFFHSNTSLDDIINWIVTNVGEHVKENPFIRTLATACFNDSIVNLELKADILQGKYNLLHRFVDNKPTYELQCLYALQTFINKLEHPQGLLLAICDKLYQENVFSLESFVAWEASKNPSEQEGKGMILEQLCSFFTRLKETNQDSSSS